MIWKGSWKPVSANLVASGGRHLTTNKSLENRAFGHRKGFNEGRIWLKNNNKCHMPGSVQGWGWGISHYYVVQEIGAIW